MFRIISCLMVAFFALVPMVTVAKTGDACLAYQKDYKAEVSEVNRTVQTPEIIGERWFHHDRQGHAGLDKVSWDICNTATNEDLEYTLYLPSETRKGRLKPGESTYGEEESVSITLAGKSGYALIKIFHDYVGGTGNGMW